MKIKIRQKEIELQKEYFIYCFLLVWIIWFLLIISNTLFNTKEGVKINGVDPEFISKEWSGVIEIPKSELIVVNEVSQNDKDRFWALQKNIDQWFYIFTWSQNLYPELANELWKFTIKDVLYVHNKILDRNLDEKYITGITLTQANEILREFEQQKYVKLKKKLAVWVELSSDTLYVSKQLNGQVMYFDENFYFFIKKSILNKHTDFLIILDTSSLEYWDQNIYQFVTWYNKDKKYYQSILSVILKSDKKYLQSIMTWDYNNDVRKNGILKSFFQICTWEKTTTFSQYEYLDILVNSF